MKTAISLDDKLMLEADRAACEIGISRSRLFSLALEDYLRNRTHAAILESLNRVYGGEPDLEEQRVVAQMKTKFEAVSSVKSDPWETS